VGVADAEPDAEGVIEGEARHPETVIAKDRKVMPFKLVTKIGRSGVFRSRIMIYWLGPSSFR
jgi:hypothetical protein